MKLLFFLSWVWFSVTGFYILEDYMLHLKKITTTRKILWAVSFIVMCFFMVEDVRGDVPAPTTAVAPVTVAAPTPATVSKPVYAPEQYAVDENSITVPITPNPLLTPGAVDPNATVEKVCTHGYTAIVRHVTEGEKNEVFIEYGFPNVDRGTFEVDHLISLELGGSNDIQNLWPQSYTSHPYNSHIKDKLENYLHAQVCKGNITLQEAQEEISHDWIAAYLKYFDPATGKHK